MGHNQHSHWTEEETEGIRVKVTVPGVPVREGGAGGGIQVFGTPAPQGQVSGIQKGQVFRRDGCSVTCQEKQGCSAPGFAFSVSILGKWNVVPSANGLHAHIPLNHC